MQRLKDENPKGRHFVYAYRYINEFDQIVENQTDDGEPKGSSGPPSLAVLRGNDLVNTAVIIVRYFGGVKLWIGGLVRAYGKAANLVIENANLIPYQKIEIYKLAIQSVGSFDHFLKSILSIKISRDFTVITCSYSIGATSEQHQRIKEFFQKIQY